MSVIEKMPEISVRISDVLSFSFRTMNVHCHIISQLRGLLLAIPGVRFDCRRLPPGAFSYSFFLSDNTPIFFSNINGVLIQIERTEEQEQLVFFTKDRRGVGVANSLSRDLVVAASAHANTLQLFSDAEAAVFQAFVDAPGSASPAGASDIAVAGAEDADIYEDSSVESSPPSGDDSGDDGSDDDSDDGSGSTTSTDTEEEDPDDPDWGPPPDDRVAPESAAAVFLDTTRQFRGSLQDQAVDINELLPRLLLEQHNFRVVRTVVIGKKRESCRRINPRSDDTAFCETRSIPIQLWERYRASLTAPFRIRVLRQSFLTDSGETTVLNMVTVGAVKELLEVIATRLIVPGSEQPATLHLQLGLDGKPATGLTVGGGDGGKAKGKTFTVWVRFANIRSTVDAQCTRRAVCIGAFTGKDSVQRVRAFLRAAELHMHVKSIAASGLAINGRVFPVHWTVVGDLPAIRAIYTAGSVAAKWPRGRAYRDGWHRGACSKHESEVPILQWYVCLFHSSF